MRCRAHSATAEVPGAPGTPSEAQGWQFSGRASNLSLVLWYPDEAPGCCIQVLAHAADRAECKRQHGYSMWRMRRLRHRRIHVLQHADVLSNRCAAEADIL